MNVRGKTALITGASRGIGKAIALELAQQGAKCLILVARDRDRLNTVASEVEALGIEAVSLPLDLSQTIEVNIAIAQVWRDFGPIDILVNCAGVAHQSSFLRSRFEDVCMRSQGWLRDGWQRSAMVESSMFPVSWVRSPHRQWQPILRLNLRSLASRKLCAES